MNDGLSLDASKLMGRGCMPFQVAVQVLPLISMAFTLHQVLAVRRRPLPQLSAAENS